MATLKAMSEEAELEHKSEIADAQLAVAEELAWPISMLSGAMARQFTDSWLIVIAIALAIFFFVIYPYRKRADQREDEYFKFAKLGKYYRPLDGSEK